MDLLLLICRIGLAAVFALAGVMKLADRNGSREAMRAFGVPAPLARPLGILVPLAELAVAGLLIPRATAWWGALAALALLAAFIVGIAVNMARGRRPDCHCFGQLHSEPIGWATLARNGLLMAVAGAVVSFGWDDAGLSAVGWAGELETAEAIGLATGLIVLGLLVAQGWLLLHLLQQNGRLLTRVEVLELISSLGELPVAPQPLQQAPGLPVGSKAPEFSLGGVHGETSTLGSLRAAMKPVVLLFSDPHCGPCNALLPEIGRWQREYADKLSLAVISRGTADANRAKSLEHGLMNVLLQQDREVARAYQSHGTPSAVVVNADGTVGSPLASGADAIRELVTKTAGIRNTIPLQPLGAAAGGRSANGNRNGAVAARSRPAAVQVGTPAPAFALPDLEGKSVDLAQFQGEETLLLFWNPGCGFCQRMLPDLKAWEAESSDGGPKLLVISTGSIDANQAMDLRSTVTLDQGFSVGRQFGASGTPSAVLIGADGRIASDVAVGAPGVLSLIGRDQAHQAAV